MNRPDIKFSNRFELLAENPAEQLIQWRQQKQQKLAARGPATKDTQAWTGFVASLQASHAKSPPRPKARKVLSEQHWTGSVRWNRAWDEAAEKEAARPTDEGAASQDADVSVPLPDAPRAHPASATSTKKPAQLKMSKPNSQIKPGQA